MADGNPWWRAKEVDSWAQFHHRIMPPHPPPDPPKPGYEEPIDILIKREEEADEERDANQDPSSG